MKQFLITAMLVAMVLSAGPAFADTWVASDGFSQTSNPNGVWSFGYQATLGGALTRYNSVINSTPGIWAWCKNSTVDAAGNVDKNVTSSPVDAQGAYWLPGQLTFHPGPTNEYAIVRWTAPNSGIMNIAVTFTGQNYGTGTTTDVHVLNGSTALFNGTINGYGGGGHANYGSSPMQTYSGIVSVAAGGTIDFAVGSGGNGFSYDLTGVSATISSVGATYNVSSISEIRSKPSNSVVNITAPVAVTATSSSFVDGSYYVEEINRAAGIKIAPQSGVAGVAVGDRITFTGVLGLDANGERYVSVISINSKSSGTALKPLGMTTKNAAKTTGLETTGLLVKIWGWVTFKSPDGAYMYIDDGSKRKDAAGMTGVRVMLSGLTNPITKGLGTDQYVLVTGHAGLVKDGSAIVRAIKPRGDADITSINGSMDEMTTARGWVRNNFGLQAQSRPFSFTYNSQLSANLLGTWTQGSSIRQIDGNTTEQTTTYTDPVSGLQVRCVATQYQDYPAVDWVVYFKNTGSADTPILENVQALNADIGGGSGNYTLYYADGSTAIATDFQPHQASFPLGVNMHFAPYDGRPSGGSQDSTFGGYLPFFNLAKPDGTGNIIAVGWTGQWAATFNRNTTTSMNVQAGMELTHLKLHPGEEIRTPSILMLFWSGGDRWRGHNQLRRIIMDHYAPRPGGQEAVPPTAASPHAIISFEGSTEANMRQVIDSIAAHNLPIDTYWIDAGWYTNYGSWADGVGNWDPDPVRYPNGMKPVADDAHSHGYKFLLWFEPERVMPNTWLYNNHPDWLLSPSNLPGDVAYQGSWRLLNFGNPSALAWAKSKFSGMIAGVGIDIYRQDFNQSPLFFWRNGEAADRKGMNEIKYVMGMYDYLDTLRSQNPNLLIDDCASGGRRIDIEMMRRAVVLTPSDYLWYPIGQQSQEYALSYWIPLHGVGGVYADDYGFRSGMGASYVLAVDFLNSPGIWAPETRLLNQYNSIKHLYKGDYYPLGSYSVADNVWMASQYDRPDLGEGIIQVFRRPNAAISNIYTLKALSPTAYYQVTYVDNPSAPLVRTGNQLMQSGLSFSLGSPGATYATYRRLN